MTLASQITDNSMHNTTSGTFNRNTFLSNGPEAFTAPPRPDYAQRTEAFKRLLHNMPYRMLLLKNLNADELSAYVAQEIRRIEAASVIKLSNAKKV